MRTVVGGDVVSSITGRYNPGMYAPGRLVVVGVKLFGFTLKELQFVIVDRITITTIIQIDRNIVNIKRIYEKNK